jgi:hypothetical protein
MTEARYSRGRVRGEQLSVPWDGRLVATYPALKRQAAIRPHPGREIRELAASPRLPRIGRL